MKTIHLTLIFALASVCTFAQPTIKTDTRYARGATKAFGRMSLVLNGNSLKESGFCWSSDSKEPTINDSKSIKKWTNNGSIYVMEGLTPATMYYARAYVTILTGETFYGDVIKFCTVPKGTIGWGYDNGGSADENARINSATQSCVDYWNDYTSIPDLYLNVHYGSGTPTADCSYGGWMRVGPNASYQRTGTIMHEALHAIGVGQCDLWYGSSSPLRKGAGTGDWLGDRANDFLKFWDNDPSAVLKGDAVHLWPYGINGAHEDNGTELLYAANSMIAQAISEDGLPCTSTRNFGLPHYSFSQEDNIKYYIKNEDEARGLTTSFLVETADHKLQWQAMSAEQALVNDAAAWYVSFTPATQLYQLKNASTGNYITYDDGIVCKAASGSTSKNSFCLMRSRIDVTSATGTKLSPSRGYWMLVPEYSNATPPCLEAGVNGTVSAGTYSNLNTAKKQRWLILDEANALAMENSGYLSACDAFDKVYQLTASLLATPHASISGDADATFNAELLTIKASYDAAKTANEVTDLTTGLRGALVEFLGNVYVTDLDRPFDMTALLNNPDFASGTTGWTVGSGGVYDYSEVEFYVDKARTATLVQLVKDMPAGTYSLKAQGFQRPGSNDQVYADYNAGINNVKVVLEMTMSQRSFVSQKVKNIMEERQTSQVHSGDKKLADGTYVPNTMASTRAHFDKGYYENSVTAYTSYSGDLRIFFKGDNSAASSWTICDNFRLYYLGGISLEEIEQNIAGIGNVITENRQSTINNQYNVFGQRVSENAKGIVIVNGKKVLRK